MLKSIQLTKKGIANNLIPLFQKYPVLQMIWNYTNFIASTHNPLAAHNPNHMMWDAKTAEKLYSLEKKINPSMKINNADIKLIIAAALLHDIGAYLGEYKKHAETGENHIISDEFQEYFSKAIKEEHLRSDEIYKIASMVGEHDSYNQTTYNSEILHDADTLNKAGIHGIYQIFNIQKEYGMNAFDVAQRMIKGANKIKEKGYYTDAARDEDVRIGEHELGGIETTLMFWQFIKEKIESNSDYAIDRDGKLTEQGKIRVIRDDQLIKQYAFGKLSLSN